MGVTRRAAKDEVAHGISSNFDVVEGPQEMDLCLSQHNARASGVFNSKFGFAILAGNAPDGAAQVVAMQRLHVFNFKSL